MSPLRALRRSALAAVALSTGCAPLPMGFGLEPATFAGSFIRAQAAEADTVQVRLEGLEFLELGVASEAAIASMTSHGYVCHAAAATRRYAPCTTRAPGAPDQVVLESDGGLLIAIETRVSPPLGDARAFLEEARERMRAADYVAILEELPAGVAVRGLPGDGSLLELRWWHGTGSVLSAQRLLTRPVAGTSHAPPARAALRSAH